MDKLTYFDQMTLFSDGPSKTAFFTWNLILVENEINPGEREESGQSVPQASLPAINPLTGNSSSRGTVLE